MSDTNPYTAPVTEEEIVRPEEKPVATWRDRDLLVVPREGTLPARCVKCNAPADGKEPLRVASDQRFRELPVALVIIAIGALFCLIGLFLLEVEMTLAPPWDAIDLSGWICLAVVAVSVLIARLYCRLPLRVQVCSRHRRRRWLSRVLYRIGVGALFSLLVLQHMEVLDLGRFSIIAAVTPPFVIAALAGSDIYLQTSRSTASLVWLSGAGKRFLASLPEFDEAGHIDATDPKDPVGA